MLFLFGCRETERKKMNFHKHLIPRGRVLHTVVSLLVLHCSGKLKVPILRVYEVFTFVGSNFCISRCLMELIAKNRTQFSSKIFVCVFCLAI